MKITAKDLRNAAPRAAEIWLESIDINDDVPEHKFSRRFEHKMKKMIRKKRTSKRGKIAIAAAAILIVNVVLFFVPVNAQKEHLIDVVASFFKGSADYTYSSDEDYDGIFGTVTINNIPDRMNKVSDTFDELTNILRIVYEDKTGDYLEIVVLIIDKSISSYVSYDTENAEIEKINIGSNEATLITDSIEGTSALFWTEDMYSISISGYITRDEAIGIAESLEIEK